MLSHRSNNDKTLLFWAAAPKGPMTYAFTHRGNFSSSSSFSSVHPLEPQIQLRSPKSSLKAQIPALKTQNPASTLKFQPWRPKSSFKAQIPPSKLKIQPCGSNFGLQAQIPASKLKFHPSKLKFQPWRPKSSFKTQIPPSKLKIQPFMLKTQPPYSFQPWSGKSSFKAKIPPFKPEFQPPSPNSNLKAQCQGSKSTLEAQIPAYISTRLKFQPPISNLSFEVWIRGPIFKFQFWGSNINLKVEIPTLMQ